MLEDNVEIFHLNQTDKDDYIKINTDKVEYINYNDEIEFKCKKGFKLSGSDKATCGKNNEVIYNGDDMPKCESQFCVKLILTQQT